MRLNPMTFYKIVMDSTYINIFCCYVILFATKLCNTLKYTNYTLFRGIPVNVEHLDFFHNLSSMYYTNYWSLPGSINKPVDFVIHPKDQNQFRMEAQKRGIYLTTLIKDLQAVFDKQSQSNYTRRNLKSFNWKSYSRLQNIYDWLEDLLLEYPDEIKLETIGTTSERRKIKAVSIILKGSKRRSKVIIEGGIHAREWISTAFVTFLINAIITRSYSDKFTKIALTYEWYLVPVLNPDGYVYTFKEDRMWRKNRSKPDGVDVNRNFDIAFGTLGISKQKFSETYCGPSAFSENESKAMAKYVESKQQNLEYYVAFHAYGQYIIIPFTHLKTHEGNYDEVASMARLAKAAIYKKYTTSYTFGTAYDTVGYTTSGVSSCWVKKQFKTPYVVTFELRDTGQYGFALPPELILPTCKETIEGLISLLTPRLKELKKNKVGFNTIMVNGNEEMKHSLHAVLIYLTIISVYYINKIYFM